jgi:glyoxylate/hydroxypyruvate reductase
MSDRSNVLFCYFCVMQKMIYIHTKFDNSVKQLIIDKIEAKYKVHFHDELLENMQFETFKKCSYCLGNVPFYWCQNAENLLWLQLHSAGIDPYHQLQKPKFRLTNLRGFFAESVAETTLAGILAFYRGLDKLTKYQLDNEWVGHALRPSLHKLHRKKVWVLGGGSIANKFIELIKPFDCDIIQTSLSELKANVHSIDFFKNNAKSIELLVLVLPEIPETIKYLHKATLSCLNANTLIVNTGRGSSIDQEILKEKLIKNEVLGAVLDVTELEPIPTNDSIWNMPNVILTQHTAGGWADEKMEIAQFFLQQLEKLELGKELENYVDCERGY